MPQYQCWFPNCEYETDDRSKIDFHHVTPREVDKRSKITVPLCKTCHALVFHPKSKSGQHSINTKKSMQILGIFESTSGKAIHYMDYDGNKMYYHTHDRSLFPDND